jgi:hypothetical protein
MMVVQYNRDILDSIIDSLLETQENCLFYSAIYKEVNKRLSKKRRKYVSISHRDFSLHLDNLVKENRLQRNENPEKKRGTRIDYCLTDKAKKEYQWNILGIDPEKERLRRLYQLLFFFESSKSTIRVTDKQLDEFLSLIESSRQEMVAAPDKMFPEGGSSIAWYKPIKDIEITKFFDGNRAFYKIRLPGFSIEEILNYEKPTLGNYESSIFCHNEFTHEELNGALNLFRKAGLIRPIPQIFASELRFTIADESVRDLIASIWKIHKEELGILHSELFFLGKPLNDVDKNKFLMFYGKHGLNELNLYAGLTQRALKKNKDYAGKRAKETEELNEYANKKINEKIEKLKDEYAPVIQHYSFPSDVIERICFRNVPLQ